MSVRGGVFFPGHHANLQALPNNLSPEGLTIHSMFA